MDKKVTISVEEAYYKEICRIAGRNHVRLYIEELIKSHLKSEGFDPEFDEMCADVFEKMGADSVREEDPQWGELEVRVGKFPTKLSAKAKMQLLTMKPSEKARKRVEEFKKLMAKGEDGEL